MAIDSNAPLRCEACGARAGDRAVCEACSIARAAELGAEVARYGGDLRGFMFGVMSDPLERWIGRGLLDDARAIVLATFGADDAAKMRIARALDAATAGDPWAREHIGGRAYLRACWRARMVATIRRHPRAARFDTLIRAIERGRFSEAQRDLAKRLAAEVAA